MKRLNLTLVLLFSISIAFAQSSYKLAFYNLLNYPNEGSVPNRSQYLNLIMADMSPDLLMACELNNEEGAKDVLGVLQNTVSSTYQMATFVNNTSDDDFGDGNNLQNLLFYDSAKFILDSQTLVPSQYRDFNHYKLRLNTTDNAINPIFLEVIVCHLKASSGEENEEIRQQMVEDLQTFLNTLSPDSYVVLGGDLNVYRASEPAFQELIDENNRISFVDPVESTGYWHNNTDYLEVFTQSTRTTGDLGGAGGGLDDRFDFILTSENLKTDSALAYVLDSYEVFGNNENFSCFNSEINSIDCAGSEYSSSLREALYNFSDHLPVSLELQTSSTLNNSEFALKNALEFVGTNVVEKVLKIRLSKSELFHQTFSIYNSLGQKLSSLAFKNSVYLEKSVVKWASGIYYVVDDSNTYKPLKFIVSQ